MVDKFQVECYDCGKFGYYFWECNFKNNVEEVKFVKEFLEFLIFYIFMDCLNSVNNIWYFDNGISNYMNGD